MPARTAAESTRRGLLRALAGGAAATAAASPAAAQSDDGGGQKPDFGSWLDGIDGGFFDARGQSSVTVRVGAQGNGGPFAFGPANLWVDPGTTVTFEWVSDNHNVEIENQPDGAGWEGYTTVENTGFTYEHTFETEGTYEYFCRPHRQLGMLAGVAVGDDVPTTQVQTGGGGGFTLPSAPGLSVGVAAFGLAGGAAGLVIGVEAVSEIRRRGGVRGPEPETVAAEEAAETDPTRELDHDEYDPWGTATLILLYFVVVVGMWLFMYFVEFLGNGPTVIG